MSHDVTAAATQGKNAVGVVGGNVMYSGSPEILAVLVFRYASGAAPTIITSGTSGWSSKKQRGSSKSVYVTAATAWATTIDWTQHDPAWSTPAYNAPGTEWAPVNASALAAATVAPRALGMPVSAVLGEVRPVKVEKVGDLGFLYTFPKNFVGTVRVGPLPGAATPRAGLLSACDQYSIDETFGASPAAPLGFVSSRHASRKACEQRVPSPFDARRGGVQAARNFERRRRPLGARGVCVLVHWPSGDRFHRRHPPLPARF